MKVNVSPAIAMRRRVGSRDQGLGLGGGDTGLSPPALSVALGQDGLRAQRQAGWLAGSLCLRRAGPGRRADATAVVSARLNVAPGFTDH